MGLLDRFFGNDQQLTRPDFNRFAHIELDFSGTKIRFKDAAHTAMFPINHWPHNIDIYDTNELSHFDDGTFGKTFYVRGWDFFGKRERAHGGCEFFSFLHYLPNKNPDCVSYFSRPAFEHEILEYCHERWGDQNPGSSVGSLGPQGSYVYPVDASGLSYEPINGINWCRFSAQWKAKPPQIIFACPITKHHLIINTFKFHAYGGTDFYSPETNLEQTCYDVTNDFMSEYFIELSPQAKAERSEASDPI